MNLDGLRKEAKELADAARTGDGAARARLGDLEPRLASARLVIAREHGFTTWAKLTAYVGLQGHEQPFRTDLGYYEGRAAGIATVERIGDAEARRELARRHGYASWTALRRRVDQLRAGDETPFVRAYRAVETGDRDLLVVLLDRYPELVRARGTNGNDLLGMATATGDERVVDLLGLEPGNLRVAAGLGRLDLIEELVGTPAAGAHRDFFRPHGGFPPWQPSDDPQEVIDEALVWAAKSGRVEAVSMLVERGARADADVYRGTPLAWAAATGRTAAVRRLLELGADPNRRATFGGPTHGQGVTALHLAAQAGRRETVLALLSGGADPTVRDELHGGDASGWAEFGGHPGIARLLREAAGAAARQHLNGQ